MINTRRSITTAVGGDGGTSNSTAGTSFRRRGNARQATTCRDERALSRSLQQGQQSEQEGGASRHNSSSRSPNNRGNSEGLIGINYMEIKKLIE